ICAACCDDPVDDTQILENFLGPRLDALPARAWEGLIHLLDKAERHATPCKVDSKCEAGCASTTDQNCEGVFVFHCRLQMCMVHISSGGVGVSTKKVQNTHIKKMLPELHRSLV